MVDPAPPRDRHLLQPGPAPEDEIVGRGELIGGVPRGSGSPQRRVEPLGQRVVDRAEQRGASRRHRGQVLGPDGARTQFAHRVGDRGAERRTAHRRRQRRQRARVLVAEASEPVDERGIDTGDDIHDIGHTGGDLGQRGNLYTEHQRVTPVVAGNHCNSGIGAVLPGNSR